MDALKLLIFFLTSALSGTLWADWQLDLSRSENEVEFHATGKPNALKVTGKMKAEERRALAGTIGIKGNELFGKAEFLLDSLDTGIELRNRHMKEKYLKTAEYPKAQFEFTPMRLPASLQGNSLPFSGVLSLLGTKRPVSGTAEIERNGSDIKMTFEFITKITRFAIEVPSFMGVTLVDEVKVITRSRGKLKELR